MLYGLFDIVEGSPLELAFLLAAAGFVYLSVALHSRTLLFVATAAILSDTAWFTGEDFADSVGWPIALIIFGLFLIALSALALRIRSRLCSSAMRGQRARAEGKGEDEGKSKKGSQEQRPVGYFESWPLTCASAVQAA